MASNPDLVNHLRDVFDVCDDENLGYISLEKLKELGYKYFGGNEEDMLQLIHSLDSRGQGIVTFPDFCKGVTTVLLRQSGCNINNGGDESPNNTNLYLPSQVILPGTSNDLSMSQDELTVSQDCLLLGGESVATCSNISGQSPTFENKRISPILVCSDEEERFECYGEGEDPETDINESGIYLESNGSYKPSLSSDSFRSTSSAGSTGSGGRIRHTRNPSQHSTWSRSSLRRASRYKRLFYLCFFVKCVLFSTTCTS
ncbi:uncharacterized protein LOC111089833, partial [Limulus polyphemus]|uniref:Uncharacterized protein LOC111089833 n=1 Tax=Limulus polyphemus TaxID=6850 RepID=A0ABM1TS42_LIMPO